jgi:N-hydroxyarylamine O-acetyltransferase
LRELGYDVDLLSARVFSNGVPGPPFDHLLLRVQLAEPWLADVGYGDSFIEPLPLRDEEQTQAGYRYRLELDEPEGVLWRRSPTTDWDAQYTFSLEPHQLNEFQEMCQHHQTSPDSPFTQKALCSLATLDGRKTLSGNRFIHTRQGQRSLRKITDATDYRAVLHQQFGIDLSVAEVAALLPTFHSSP